MQLAAGGDTRSTYRRLTAQRASCPPAPSVVTRRPRHVFPAHHRLPHLRTCARQAPRHSCSSRLTSTQHSERLRSDGSCQADAMPLAPPLHQPDCGEHARGGARELLAPPPGPPPAAHRPPARSRALQAGVGAALIGITAVYLDDDGKCYLGGNINSQANCNCELSHCSLRAGLVVWRGSVSGGGTLIPHTALTPRLQTSTSWSACPGRLRCGSSCSSAAPAGSEWPMGGPAWAALHRALARASPRLPACHSLPTRRGRCGMGKWADSLLQIFQCLWWAIGCGVLGWTVGNADGKQIANEGWRHSVLIMVRAGVAEARAGTGRWHGQMRAAGSVPRAPRAEAAPSSR